MAVKSLVLIVFHLFLLFVVVPVAWVDNQQIIDVTHKPTSFNPSNGGKIRLSYKMAQSDKVSLHIYDPDGGLVRTLFNDKLQNPGAHEAVWGGRDEEGRIVPDEAYTFTIGTASGAVYDPTTFSGGIVGDITDAQFTAEGTLSYKLPAAARVLIRLGIHNGPMLKSLVDWKPRVAGMITEYWDGRDEHKLIQLRGHENFTSLITYVTLPDATVITYGNKKETYRAYKLGRAKDRPQKPARARRPDPKLHLRPEHLVPPAWAQPPRVRMTFPDQESKGEVVPKVKDKINVRIEVDSSDRDYLLRDQFEIIFFVDNIFFAEAERGYLPFNWRWELHQMPAGDHVLTVNISSFKGQVGVASRKVKVVKND